jgi:ubiquinone/menaquinone biosynthesis C-methylase UbiE
MSSSHPKPGTAEYDEHVREEIEHYNRFFEAGEGRQTLMQPIPPSWQEVERRAAMVVHQRTGDFLNGHVAKRLAKREGTRFLSLGCGPGGMEIEYAKASPGSHFVCMDLNAGLLDLGRERARELGLDMEFVPCDLNVVELPRNAFDVVYCAASLHHVIELEHVAGEISRALVPDGELVTVDVVTPNGYLMAPKTREVAKAIWKTLPPRFRVNHTADTRPKLDTELWEADTSQHGMECVRSGDILPVLARVFEVREYVPYFSISRRFLDTMYGPNYDLARPLDKALFEWIWALDRHYIDSGTLPPETFFGVYAPRRGK